MEVKEFDTYAKNTWCRGCGDFGILFAVKKAFTELVNEKKYSKEQLVACTGIGCHGKMFDYLNVNAFYCLHGRAVPVSAGIKIANPNLVVVNFVGDGDVYGEGISHLLFSAKRNSNITVLVHNNGTYALTAGQFSPTSLKGFKGKSTPKGSVEYPLNPIKLMLAGNASFVARAFVGDIEHLKETIKEAVNHKGFSIVDILQPSITFNDTFRFYKTHTYKLSSENHDTSSFDAAMKKACEWDYTMSPEDKVALGTFYKKERETFEEGVRAGIDLSKNIGSMKDFILDRYF